MDNKPSSAILIIVLVMFLILLWLGVAGLVFHVGGLPGLTTYVASTAVILIIVFAIWFVMIKDK